MTKYGYITDDSYTVHQDDLVWEFIRVDDLGQAATFKGIETQRNITSSKVVIVGNAEAFNAWRNKNESPL